MALQYTKQQSRPEPVEVFAQPLTMDLAVAHKLAKPVSIWHKIVGPCYALPFYSQEKFPYILAMDAHNQVQLINTSTGNRLSLIRLRCSHKTDIAYDISFTVRSDI